jgi:hypothetical protein
MIKNAIYPKAFVKIKIYERLLNLLCLLNVIPLAHGKNNTQSRFKILSIPTLLSTLWCWIPLSYFIYVITNWPSPEDDSTNSNKSIIKSCQGYI